MCPQKACLVMFKLEYLVCKLLLIKLVMNISNNNNNNNSRKEVLTATNNVIYSLSTYYMDDMNNLS